MVVTDLSQIEFEVRNGIQEILREDVDMAEEAPEVESVPKFREIVRETIVEGPPGHHGCILEIDLGRVNEDNITTEDLLRIYSLRSVQVTIQEPLTLSECSE